MKRESLTESERAIIFILPKFKQSEIARKMGLSKQLVKQKIDNAISIFLKTDNKYRKIIENELKDNFNYIDFSIYGDDKCLLSLMGKKFDMHACNRSMVSKNQISIASIRKSIMEEIKEKGLPLQLPPGNKSNSISVLAKNVAMQKFFCLSKDKTRILFIKRESFLVNFCLWANRNEDIQISVYDVFNEMKKCGIFRDVNSIEELKNSLKRKIQSVYKKKGNCKIMLLSFIGMQQEKGNTPN